MNFPTSDLQFVAQMLLRTRSNDQITAADAARLEAIARDGHSGEPIESSVPPREPEGQI